MGRILQGDCVEVMATMEPNGLLCPSCFDKRARKLGVIVIFDATEFRRLRKCP